MDALRLAQNALLVAVVVAAMVTDIRARRIPNVLTYPAMLAGLALGAFEGVPGAVAGAGLADHVSGLFLAFALAYPLYALRLGLGAGDAKLLMAVGALRGAPFLLSAALYGSLLGGVLALVLMALRRLDPPERDEGEGIRRVMKSRIPYGVALGSGALLALAMAP